MFIGLFMVCINGSRKFQLIVEPRRALAKPLRPEYTYMPPPSPESSVQRDAPRRQPLRHWLHREPAAGAGGSAPGGCGGAGPAAAAAGFHGRVLGAGGRGAVGAVGAAGGAGADADARGWWC